MTTTSRLVSMVVFVTVAGVAAQNPGPGTAEQFYAAIRTGDVGKVTALLQTGADVNVKDRRGGEQARLRSEKVINLMYSKESTRTAFNATPVPRCLRLP